MRLPWSEALLSGVSPHPEIGGAVFLPCSQPARGVRTHRKRGRLMMEGDPVCYPLPPGAAHHPSLLVLPLWSRRSFFGPILLALGTCGMGAPAQHLGQKQEGNS